MGKLQTFVTARQAKVAEYETLYINNTLEALKMPLQEFFSNVQGITGLARNFDKADIMVRELDARITADVYESAFEKERDEVDKLYWQTEKYLINKELEKANLKMVDVIAQVELAKGVV